MIELPYTALVTAEEVRIAALSTLGNALGEEVEAALGDLYEAAIDAIMGATSMIESYLNRELIVRRHRLVFCDSDWRLRPGYENADGERLFSAWAPRWPVVEVVGVDGDAGAAVDVVLQDARPGGQLLSYDGNSTLITEHPFEIEYFAGYRRADQGVGPPGSGDTFTEDLTDPSGAGLALTVATEDVPILPFDIRRCALRISIAEVREQMLGLVGIASFTKQVERMTVEGRRPDFDFAERELIKIFPYRLNPV